MVVQQGKVRHIGISTTLPDIETFIDWGVFEAFQIPYSALERRESRGLHYTLDHPEPLDALAQQNTLLRCD